MSATPEQLPRAGSARVAVGMLALAALAAAGGHLAYRYVTNPAIPRPHDFLQVWSAGRLAAAGENPYDAERMYALQVANRMPDCRTAERPDGYASMMWVPPWGLAVALPVGALPVDAAQLLWLLGQLALIAGCALAVWRQYGGSPARRWVPVALVLASGPVWWQTVAGQNAGLLLTGVVGFLAAQRAGRPTLAGALLAPAALKPHLLVPLAVGLLIDAVRTAQGRRVALGGVLALGAAAAVVTAFNPAVWWQYAAAVAGPGSRYHPGLSEWFSPTAGAWLRHALPGRPFWVQAVPCAVAAGWFAVYWWRRGDPARWPAVLPWLIPVGLLTAPYGAWPSDLVLFLVPAVAVAARLDARGSAPSARLTAAALLFAAANAGVVALTAGQAAQQWYVWAAPAFAACLLCAAAEANRPVPAPAPV